MTNPDGYPREGHLKFTKAGTSDTITYRENDDSKLMVWEFGWDENYSKRISAVISNDETTSTVNLLNSSCAEWTGATTGDLDLGDEVLFGLYQSDGSTVDEMFRGVITNIKAGPGRTIIIEAYDYSKRLEYIKPSITHGANFADRDRHVMNEGGQDFRVFMSVTNNDILEPLVKVGVAHTDVAVEYGSGAGGTSHTLNADDEYAAQPFIAAGDTFMGFTVNLTAAAYNGDLTYQLCADNDGVPGTVLAEETDTIPGTGAVSKDWTTGAYQPEPKLVKGQRYWLKCVVDNYVAGTIQVDAQTAGSDDVFEDYLYDSGGGDTWEADNVLNVGLDFADHDDIDPENVIVHEPSNLVYFKDAEPITEIGGKSYAPARGELSYYYGTFTLEALFQRLIKLNTGLLHDVSTNCDRTMKIYSTQGKSLAQCMRELCELFETSGSWDGYQHVMAHYVDGSTINRLKVCKRKKTSDSATYILSHGEDTANDDEHIIIGEPRLQKTNRRKYAQVTVVGKGADDNPIVCTRSDKAVSGGFWDKMSGIAETLVVTDQNLRSVDAINTECYRLLNAINRDVWEGTILLSGQHEDMMDWDNSSSTYGSGNIITLNWSPLGISTTKFKVKGMVMRPTETEIYISNVDPLLLNKITNAMGSAEKSESFHIPIGFVNTIYCETYHTSSITTGSDPLYAKLRDASDTNVDWPRIECVKYADTDYNLRTYYIEVPAGFSEGIQGIGSLLLYDAASGGSLIATIDLNRTVSSIVIDERPDKLFNTRLIIEVNAANS